MQQCNYGLNVPSTTVTARCVNLSYMKWPGRGARIQERRKELGLTLAGLGQLVGVSHAAVKKWESDDNVTMERASVQQLAVALQRSEEWILGEPEKPGRWHIQSNSPSSSDSLVFLLNACPPAFQLWIGSVIRAVAAGRLKEADLPVLETVTNRLIAD